MKAIKKSTFGSAAGGSGLRPNHIYELSKVQDFGRGSNLMPLVHQNKVQEIASGSARTRIMRSLMKLPEPRRGPIAVLRPGMQHTYCITISRFGCNTIANFHSFGPERDAKGHSVQLSWTPMGIIYCIAKEVPIEFGDMMHR